MTGEPAPRKPSRFAETRRAATKRARDTAEQVTKKYERTWVGELTTRLLEASVRDRALMLAGQAFLALIPALVVLAAVAGSSGSVAVGEWLIERFDLSGDAARAVEQLFSRPPSAGGALSIVGLLFLLVSINSFGRLFQRTYEVAWGLSPRAAGRAWAGFGAIAVLILTVLLVSWSAELVRGIPLGLPLSLTVQVIIAVGAWWLMAWLLLSRRIAWILLLPGAIVCAVGQTIVTFAGSIYVPILIERDAARYGVIGVAIALLSWLVVLAFLIVGCAVVSAVIGPKAGPWLAKQLGHPVVVDAGRES